MAEYVSACPDKPKIDISGAGSGDILVNEPSPFQKGMDLVTKEEFGDIDLELEFLMVKGSKSGIVLQGFYEVQLADSWGTQELAADANGGIVDIREPRQGAARAPGLWQQLKVSFKSARFDQSGHKIEHAVIRIVELNGVLIHRNVIVNNPSVIRGIKERATTPLRIQGTDGPLAIRNIRITAYEPEQLPPLAPEEGHFNPVYIATPANTVQRSFVDIGQDKLVLRAVNLGTDYGIHFTYDLACGDLIQIWRGDFLDFTPMWSHRGNRPAKASGMTVLLNGKTEEPLTGLTNRQRSSAIDSLESNFKILGYDIDRQGIPIFKYEDDGILVSDKIVPQKSGEGFFRYISMEGDLNGVYYRLAGAEAIDRLSELLFRIGGKSGFYIRIEAEQRNEVILRKTLYATELLLPASSDLHYTILF